jgi:molecular chaperone DnaK (HSP70)
MILTKIKRRGRGVSGREIKQAVITVPAYFDDRQRRRPRTPARSPGST